jgi:hypothetical protein
MNFTKFISAVILAFGTLLAIVVMCGYALTQGMGNAL